MQQNQVIADFLRDFVSDDGQGGDDAEFSALQKCGGDQDAVDKVMESITDQDQQPGAAPCSSACGMISRKAAPSKAPIA